MEKSKKGLQTECAGAGELYKRYQQELGNVTKY
jgi:hypothetical protein